MWRPCGKNCLFSGDILNCNQWKSFSKDTSNRIPFISQEQRIAWNLTPYRGCASWIMNTVYCPIGVWIECPLLLWLIGWFSMCFDGWFLCRYFGSAEGCKFVETASCGNVKRSWVNYGLSRDWISMEQGQVEWNGAGNSTTNPPLSSNAGRGISIPCNRGEEHMAADGRDLCQLNIWLLNKFQTSFVILKFFVVNVIWVTTNCDIMWSICSSYTLL